MTISVPPKFDAESPKVYLSATNVPFQFSKSFVTFSYTDACFDDGTYCDNTTGKKEDCPKGSYCKPGQSVIYQPNPCKAGKYQDETKQSDCKTCTKGNMCPDDGLENVIICEAGFICDISGISTPMVTCPPGHYCEEGTDTQNLNLTETGINY